MNGALSRLRFPAEQSRGRRYPEPAHPYRNEFQRDRDRVIHSRAFRRLENKTQVFTAPLSDHFRNRLTHSIEVSQISRTIAAALGLNEDLTEALALAHDIGHPPFAHAGEEELNRQMEVFGDRFDHNLHALRIVEKFEHRYARFHGLNLTFEVREGIVKHSRDFGCGEAVELDEYLPGVRPPLEAQLIDLADEIAYNTSDLDDGFSADLFNVGQVRQAVPQFDRFYEEMEMQFPGAPEEMRLQEVVRRLVDFLVTGLLEGTKDAAESAGVRDHEDVRQHGSRIAMFHAETQMVNRQIKQFLHWQVYNSDVLLAERRDSTRMVGEMFPFFLSHRDALPLNYQEAMEKERPYRVICDYIAGMTDGFFARTYAQLLGEPVVSPVTAPERA